METICRRFVWGWCAEQGWAGFCHIIWQSGNLYWRLIWTRETEKGKTDRRREKISGKERARYTFQRQVKGHMDEDGGDVAMHTWPHFINIVSCRGNSYHGGVHQLLSLEQICSCCS